MRSHGISPRNITNACFHWENDVLSVNCHQSQTNFVSQSPGDEAKGGQKPRHHHPSGIFGNFHEIC